jgi:thiamine-phosphate pyrophosphorylase
MLIAVSTHSMQQAKDAEARGADFITFGPVYSTPSKAQYGPPVGVDALRAVCREIRIPVFGLGGISESLVETVLSAGAAGIALISAILAAPDIERAASDFVARVQKTSQNRTTPSTKG